MRTGVLMPLRREIPRRTFSKKRELRKYGSRVQGPHWCSQFLKAVGREGPAALFALIRIGLLEAKTKDVDDRPVPYARDGG